MTAPARTMSAKEAIALLAISPQTLYAYVSRGLIRSEPGEGRTHRYLTEDVLKLKAMRSPQRAAEHAAGNALRWGTPVLDSAITLVTGEALFYRGIDVRELAARESIESVAVLLWGQDPRVHPLPLARLAPPDAAHSVIQRFTLALAALPDAAAYSQEPARVAAIGLHILHTLTTVLAGEGDPSAPTAARIAAAWRADPRLIDAALILCADHELNASAFAARVAASTGATPYAAVIAGLSALSGARHGGGVDRCAALLHEVRDPGRARAVLEGRLRRGETVPGFGHTLYPNGDPRAAALLTLMRAHGLDERVEAVIAAAAELIGQPPTIDLGLAALEVGYGLPDGAGLALFAVGRSVGWVAHVIEQYATGELIRPRARYVGVMPG